MNRSSVRSEAKADAAALRDALQSRIKGEVRFDPLFRTLYSTDASIYEIIPLGVVLPKDVDDVVAVVDECRKCGTSIVPRGAGTGLTGGAVGPGVQTDLSRYMNRIGEVDVQGRSVEVEPGVVLDELNAHLAPYGLQFAPDVATSNRATIGGMIANNSCGARSIVYGRTIDHILELTVVLADGTVAVFGGPSAPASASGREIAGQAARLEDELGRIRDECYEEIQRRSPKVFRNTSGYGLDRLGPRGEHADAVNVLCGSEGTLGVVVKAKLKLVPIPRHTGLLVLHFAEVLDALDATPRILEHKPSAVELIDRPILEAGRKNLLLSKRCDFLQGDPSALLVVEFQDDDATRLALRIDALSTDRSACVSSYAATRLLEPKRQTDVWNLRKAGLGLLMSRPGDAQPYAFVEDSAVDPARLREYIARFTALLEQEGVPGSFYAHASAGCIHVRPVLNLKKAEDIERMRRIAESVSNLALEFGGTITAEHGDGIVRSCWIEKMYGPTITAAFRRVKQLFDPHNLFNPHKIVDPWPMTERLRYGPSFATQTVKTYLDFSAYGGMAGLGGMCSGVGQCRQRLVGAMCPSYMATGDETHTTRARANALRVALSNHGLLNGLDDPHLAEVMELCLSCKACKAECPTGVDMARLKSEYLAQKHLKDGAGRRARFVAEMPQHLAAVSLLPGLSNLLMRSKPVRAFIEHRYGLDRRSAPPSLARQTFQAWFRRHRRRQKDGGAARGSVVYFLDTWTNYFTPQVGIAAVKLLERVGFEVVCPQVFACGRPAISQGLLAEAKHTAETNVKLLVRLASEGVPIVGTEPSSILTVADEYPQLVRSPAARIVASQALTIESFLRKLLDDAPDALRFKRPQTSLLFHTHCHEKALVGSTDTAELLRRVWGAAASEINSGCCGMAGAFGHEVEHYEIARMIGEQRLFPAVRNRGDAQIAASGFSCREHIKHHTGVPARHVVEYLADLLT